MFFATIRIDTTGSILNASATEMFGKAKVGREEFRATAESDIAAGTKVKVTHAEGITLTVVPE